MDNKSGPWFDYLTKGEGSAAEALRGALRAVYDAFSNVSKPANLKHSPYRDAEEVNVVLADVPLSQLTESQIGPYSGWAVTTVGDGDDYRYFVPRILQLAVEDPVWMGTTPTVIAEKMIAANWRGWPKHEREAVLGFFDAATPAMKEMDPEDDMYSSGWQEACALLQSRP